MFKKTTYHKIKERHFTTWHILREKIACYKGFDGVIVIETYI